MREVDCDTQCSTIASNGEDQITSGGEQRYLQAGVEFDSGADGSKTVGGGSLRCHRGVQIEVNMRTHIIWDCGAAVSRMSGCA